MALFGNGRNGLSVLSAIKAGASVGGGLGRATNTKRRRAAVSGKVAAKARKAVSAFVAGQTYRDGAFISDGKSLSVGQETFATRTGRNRVKVCLPRLNVPAMRAAASAMLNKLGTGIGWSEFDKSNRTMVLRGRGRAGSSGIVLDRPACAEVILNERSSARAESEMTSTKIAAILHAKHPFALTAKQIKSTKTAWTRLNTNMKRVSKQAQSKRAAAATGAKRTQTLAQKALAAKTVATRNRLGKQAQKAAAAVVKLRAQADVLQRKASLLAADVAAFANNPTLATPRGAGSTWLPGTKARKPWYFDTSKTPNRITGREKKRLRAAILRQNRERAAHGSKKGW